MADDITATHANVETRVALLGPRAADLKIVAEGVETREQLQFLRAEGCDLVQGFLMSKALPAPSFAELVGTRQAGEPAAAEEVARNAGGLG